LLHNSRNNFETQPKPFFTGREIVLTLTIDIFGANRPTKRTAIAMTAIAKVFSNVFPAAIPPDVEIFKTIALFCGAGLLVSLLLAAGLSYLPAEPHTLDVMDWI
jgi:hypothetical protein